MIGTKEIVIGEIQLVVIMVLTGNRIMPVRYFNGRVTAKYLSKVMQQRLPTDTYRKPS